MTQQFPNPAAENSDQAFRRLMETLDQVKDNRILLWLSQWMLKAAQDKVVASEEKLIRQERFEYTDDAARTRSFLEQHRQAVEVATAFTAWIQMLTIEKDIAAMFSDFRKTNVPKKAR